VVGFSWWCPRHESILDCNDRDSNQPSAVHPGCAWAENQTDGAGRASPAPRIQREPVVDIGKDLVRRHFDEMWNERNFDLCEELMAVTFTEHAPPPFSSDSPGAVNGPKAMRGTCTWLLEQFPDLTMTVEMMIAEGDLVAALVWAEGTNRGKLNGFLPPSGRPFKYRQTHWFRVRDAQLCEHWATRDDLAAMLQLGVVTPPRLGALGRQLRANARYRFRRT